MSDPKTEVERIFTVQPNTRWKRRIGGTEAQVVEVVRMEDKQWLWMCDYPQPDDFHCSILELFQHFRPVTEGVYGRP